MSFLDERSDFAKGLTVGISTQIVWGMLTIYWNLIDGANSFEILAHRILWSLPALAFILLIYKRFGEVFAVFRSKKNLRLIMLSGFVISFSWLAGFYAVVNGRILDFSLGTYCAPLISLIFGYIFMKEKLNKVDMISVGFVVFGIMNLVFVMGVFPFIAVFIAVTFGLYGVVRKYVPVMPIPGTFVELMFVSPVALTYIMYLHYTGNGTLGNATLLNDFLLIASGAVTSIGMLGYIYAMRRLKLITAAILQYVSPTINFLLGVFMYKEEFNISLLITFISIWIGILTYMSVNIINYKKKQKLERA